jgi:hypothetical protein
MVGLMQSNQESLARDTSSRFRRGRQLLQRWLGSEHIQSEDAGGQMGQHQESRAGGDALDRRIDELNLRKNVRELSELGYTLLQDPGALAIADQMRETIIRLSRETTGEFRGRATALLLGRDPVFAKAVTLPSLLTLFEAVLGHGTVVSQLLGSVRPKGSPTIGMHVDNSWFPEPFPTWELSCTACWVTDLFTKDGGCTYVIPRTHLMRRHPPQYVRQDLEKAVPLDAPKGSIWLWAGSLWHGNYPRVTDGDRVVLHMTFNRLGIHPIEDYGHLDSAWLKEQPEEMASLLGRRNLFGTTTYSSGGVDIQRAAETFRSVHGRDVY